MARRRHENGLKYQQRIETEQRNNRTDHYVEPDDRKPEPTHPAPVPPGVTQLFENVAPPHGTYELHEPHEPHEPDEPREP